jgi:cation diffusion facilitator CzcD-associated flavoprotein CzcO
MSRPTPAASLAADVDVVIVGAGFVGMCGVHGSAVTGCACASSRPARAWAGFVESAHLDEDDLTWVVGTSRHEQVRPFRRVGQRGALDRERRALPGLHGFRGRVLHTGAWPHEPVDFAGRAVAVIGTGSSGTQLLPQVAETARQVYVHQRTPNFSIPAHNYRYEPEHLARLKAAYRERRAGLAECRRNPVPAAGNEAFDVGDE